MITIAIDKRYRTIDRLYFAGLGSDNRPIWVTMNPGEPITVTAITENSLGQLVYYHLGVDGDEVPSFLIAQILGMSFDYSYRHGGVSMMDNISKMKSLNLKWKKDPLEFVFTIYDESTEDKEEYLLIMDDKEGHPLVEETIFHSLNEADMAIDNYLLTLRMKTEIPVTKVYLRAPKRVVNRWKKSRLYKFYDCTAFEDEPDDFEDRKIIDYV